MGASEAVGLLDGVNHLITEYFCCPDRVFAIETDRGVLITPYDPDFDAAMQAFDEVRRQYRNTLRKLAE